MKRLTRLAVLSLLVPALALPAGAASAKDHGGGGGGGGPLCWVLGWGCDDDDNGDDDDDVVVAPAPAYLIQGVAVDSSGKGLDNVAVQALDASTGQPVATALTYASARRNGPQHGYFYLYVDKGVYDVALVKRGYDASFVQDVNVNGRKDVSLGQLTLGLRDWPTSTVAEVVDPVVTPNEPVLVDVTVDSEKAKVTGGRVVVSEGRRTLANERLTKADRGVVTVNVGRLAKGTHKLLVEYKAVDGLKSSSSKTFKVTVAPRSHRKAPGGRPLTW